MRPTIKIPPEQLSRIQTALSRVIRMMESEKRNLPLRSASAYKFRLYRNLTGARYSSTYSPYNKKYGKWKAKQNVGMEFWLLWKSLLHNLSMYKGVHPFFNKEGWIVGIPMGARGADGRDINVYGLTMEFGNTTNKQSPRPLFVPTFEEFFDIDGIRLIDFSAKNILRQWR